MAQVVDVRGSGGDLIILGGALTLPTATFSVATPIAGSIRYNASSVRLEFYNGTSWAGVTGTVGVTSVIGNTGAVTLSQLVSGGLAPLSSPALVGTPTAPSATVGTNTTQIATTAFVLSELATLAASARTDTTNAANITSGTLIAARLPADVAYIDIAQSYTKAQRAIPFALTDATTIAVDLSQSNNFKVTLAGNRTLGNPTNIVAGQAGQIVITQDATGSRTLAYGSDWKFSGGVPTLSTAANAIDILSYYVIDGTHIAGSLSTAFA